MKKLNLAILLGLALILGLSLPVCAANPEPDSVSLDEIIVYHDLIEDGDSLVYISYDIQFDAPPDDTIDETFLFRQLSSDGSTEIGITLATPLYNGGYGNGVISFYYISGLTDNETYIFRVQENPLAYPGSLYWDFTIGAVNYSTATNQALALKAKVIESAIFLATPFDTTLLTTSEAGTTVLNTSGEIYFLDAIPGLQSMCPTLFSVQLENPDYTAQSWAYTLSNTLKTKYSGTFVYDFMTGFAGLFSTTTTASMNFISILIFAGVIMLSIWKFKGTMMSALIDGYVVLILLMLMGFADMVMTGALAFCSSTLGGVVAFLNRA